MLDLLIDPNAWAALVTLSVLEIVLGIDNVVFISILVTRLSPAQSRQARRIGLSLALVFRIGFLFLLTWLIGLKAPVLSAFGIMVRVARGRFYIERQRKYEDSEPYTEVWIVP